MRRELIGGVDWLEALPDAVALISGDGRVAAANAQCERLLGWQANALVGQPAALLLPGWTAAEGARNEQHQPASEPVRELVARCRDGREIPVDVTSASVAVGNDPFTVLVLRDASERRAILEDLRLRSIALDEAANGIAITALDGEILWVNRAVTRLTGYERDELVGQRPNLLRSGVHDEQFYRDLWATIRAGRTWHGTIVNRRKDGTVYEEEQTIAPVRDAAGAIRHFVAVKQDATERNAAERRLRDAHQALSSHVAQVEQLQSLLQEQVVRDPLTHLFNRRYFDETLEREVVRAQREGLPLTLAMIDVDGFKQVNDGFGHAAGDRLLASLGRLLLARKRIGDLACRFGGDEFAVVLLGADLEVGRERAEGWRRSFGEQPAADGREEVSTTLSVGLAELARDESAHALLRRADSALYRAKQSGRNRVLAAGSELVGVEEIRESPRTDR